MEFDPTVLINELGGAAPFFLVVLWRVLALEKKIMALEKKINNGLTAKVAHTHRLVKNLDCVKGKPCPEEVDDAA